MKNNNKKWVKKNLSSVHITGAFLGLIFAIIYYCKRGQFSDNVLKNNIFLISIWGLLLGYFTFDLIKNTFKKKENNNDGNES